MKKNERRKFLQKMAFIPFMPSILHADAFKSNREDQKKIRIAIASDGHFGQPDTEYKRYFNDLVNWLNLEKSEKGLDMVFINGDIIHDEPTMMPIAKSYLDKLKTNYFPVRGNHDMVSLDYWQNIWGVSTNYVIDIENHAFVVADTSDEKGTYLCADLDWLKKTLDGLNSKESIFLLLHISQSDWTKFGTHCEETMNLIAEYSNVRGVFHGHDHQEDSLKMHGKVPFFFCGHFGGSWGVDYRGYRILELETNGSKETYMYDPAKKIRLNSFSYT